MRNSGEFDNFENRNKLISVFGSYLGECLVRSYDGMWKQHESGDWCVAFEDGTMAFPFNKVTKLIDGGPFEGISSFYRAVPVIMKPRSLTGFTKLTR
jgi:hypothetical protein